MNRIETMNKKLIFPLKKFVHKDPTRSAPRGEGFRKLSVPVLKIFSPTPDPAPKGGEKEKIGDFAALLCRNIPETSCSFPLLPEREKGKGMRVKIGGQTSYFSGKFLGSVAFLMLIASLLLSGCAGLASAFAGQTTATPPPPVSAGRTVTAEGHVVPANDASLSFLNPGTVTAVKVKAGDQVKKGDVLASLGDRDAALAGVSAAQLELDTAQRQLNDLNKKAALGTAQAQADLTAAQQASIQAQQKLTDLDTSDYTKRLDDAREKVNTAADDLKTVQDDFNKVKDLAVDNQTRKNADNKLKDQQKLYDTAVHTRDLITNEMDQAKAQVDFAKARVDDATATRDARKNGPDPADLTLAQSRLKNAQNQLAAAQAALNRLDLVAPYDGTAVRVDVSLGDQAVPGQPAIIVADLTKWYVETSDLTEKDVVSVEVGQKATIVPDALPDLSLTGTVETIGQTFVEKSGDIDYVVRLPLDSSDARLRWGMTVKVTFKPK